MTTPNEPSPAALLNLLGLTAEIATGRDPDEILERLLDAAIGLLAAERGFIVVPKGADDFEIGAARNMGRRAVAKEEAEISQTIVREAIRERRTILAGFSLENHGRRSRSLRRINFRTALVAPLVAHEATEGAIILEERKRATAFRQEDEQLLALVTVHAAHALERHRLALANVRLEKQLEAAQTSLPDHPFKRILGSAPALRPLLTKLERACRSDAAVLIEGESGTGKGVVARSLHEGGKRKDGPFVTVNVAEFSETVLESELFGHEKGAFTGAVSQRSGLIAAADGGTLFLDEIGEMAMSLQAKLLRVVEEREVRRVGATESHKIDVRIVSATSRNLEQRVAKNLFRRDLYHRLKVVSLETPPLRDRVEDIPLLARHFLCTAAADEGREVVPRLDRKALAALEKHDWPGNIRELEHAIRSALVLGNDPIMAEDLDLPRKMRKRSRLPRKPLVLDRETLIRAFKAAKGNVSQAAKALGISRSSYYRKKEELQLP